MRIQDFLARGGPAIWAIAALSVLTLALILWKIWRLILMGAWAGRRTEAAVRLWEDGFAQDARAALSRRRSLRAIVAHRAMQARLGGDFNDTTAREEIRRVASRELARAPRRAARARPHRDDRTVAGAAWHGSWHDHGLFRRCRRPGRAPTLRHWPGGIWEALLTTAGGHGGRNPGRCRTGLVRKRGRQRPARHGGCGNPHPDPRPAPAARFRDGHRRNHSHRRRRVRPIHAARPRHPARHKPSLTPMIGRGVPAAGVLHAGRPFRSGCRD